MDVEELRKERTDNMHAVLNNVMPTRVPCNISMGQNAIAEYGNVDPVKSFWDFGLLEDTIDELCEKIPTDVNISGGHVLLPSLYQSIGSKAIKMGADGFMQHPNTHMMEPDEYDEFIKDPYAFVVETAAPRVNTDLDIKEDAGRAQKAMYLMQMVNGAVNAKRGAVSARMSKKHGYAPARLGGGGGYAPMDILSDQLRSFSGMSTDIRRYRSKVKDAVEAVSPWNKFCGKVPDPANYTRDAYGFYPFHMATFMRVKDFEELWFPALKRQWDDFASHGWRCGAFLEDNWMHLLDYVQELPTGSVFTFEYAEPKEFKERLGKKFVLSSGFPVKYITQCSKEEVIARTKEWIDIFAPGGQYIFGFDKSILTLSDFNMENMVAVAQTVREYAVYDDPGTPTGEIFHSEDYNESDLPEFTSRAYRTWDEYLGLNPNTPENAKDMIMNAEYNACRFYYSLLQ